MKLGHSIEYNKRNNFPQKSSRNKARRLVTDLLLFFKNAFEVKASGLELSFNIFQ